MKSKVDKMEISCENEKGNSISTRKRKKVRTIKDMELEKPYILSSLELPVEEDGSFNLAKHEANCIGILYVIFRQDLNEKSYKDASNTHLWRYAQHYLVSDYPPFMRFLEPTSVNGSLNSPCDNETENNLKRMRLTKNSTQNATSSLYCRRNQKISDEEIWRICIQYLDLDVEHFRQLWPWDRLISKCYSLLHEPFDSPTIGNTLGDKEPENLNWLMSNRLSNKSKWLAVECFGRLCPNLVELKRVHLFSMLTNTKCGNIRQESQDYNSYAVEEIMNQGQSLKIKSKDKSSENFLQDMSINDDGKCRNRIVEVEGEKLLNRIHHDSWQSKRESSQQSSENLNPFVNVCSQRNNLAQMALAVKQGKAVLIRGPVGCGKTRLIQHLAAQTGHHKNSLFQVNMSDQLDGRALIGGYSCRDIPGQFHWEDGVATKAVEQGTWLLVEDADQAFRNNAGSDGGVAGILTTLIEKKELHLPSRGVVLKAAPGFQLFLTQRVATNEASSVEISAEDNLLSAISRTKGMVEVVTLRNHSGDELKMIATKHRLFNQTYPEASSLDQLDGLAEKMVSCFIGLKERSDLLSPGQVVAIEAQKRTLSLRDFLKWYKRCLTSSETSKRPLTPEIIVLEGMDCFTNHLPNSSREKYERVHGIGRMFGLLSNHIDHMISHRVPALKIMPASTLKAIGENTNGQETIEPSIPSTGVQYGHLVMGRATLNILSISNTTDVLAKRSNLKPFFLTPSAAKLLEFIAVAVQGTQQKGAEPVLLVGETGVGKTSAVQYLAGLVGRQLVTVNLNQQTESTDLLGGYKPVNIEHFIKPVRANFETLFVETFTIHDNAKFMAHLSTCYGSQRWEDLLKLMLHAAKKAQVKCQENDDSSKLMEWNTLQTRLDRLLKNVSTLKSGSESGTLGSKLLFSFVNGVLAEAAKKGDWILLDEINMAEAEVLECLSEVMNAESDRFAVSSSAGDVKDDMIIKNKKFRVFACMNPATDVGKKQLPDGLRNRFTEYYIEEPSTKEELIPIVNDYLKRLNDFSDETKNICEKIVKFYFEIKRLADKFLVDGTGHKPTFSLRTLCRALTVAIENLTFGNSSVAPTKENSKRFLLEGFLMCFLTELDRQSYPIVLDLIFKYIAGGKKKALSLLASKFPKPEKVKSAMKGFVSIESFWIACGSDEDEPHINESFILTETVRQNLRDVARVVSLSNHAVLLQGETSVGKTSLISYLGEATGNPVVRINNHEHTDIQEYLGAYAVDPKTGCFTFVEGVLAKAMRNGHWVILDELNLAPSDVLEALNRVLDDNRELFIPETQTTIKASGNFRIFATQNPSGKYGGRKSLSRAFRNRFIELHFGELPPSEVSEIIHRHCKIEPKASKKLVAVARELKMSRINTGAGGCDPNALLEKNLTLRDLFRWANRCYSFQQVTKYHNWDQHFAQEGYLVLASKMRRSEDKVYVQKVLEKNFKCKINPESLFDLSINTKEYVESGKNSKQPIVTIRAIELIKEALYKQGASHQTEIIWTTSAVRLAVLILHSLQFKEPILMVGETGCGKTSIAVMVAKIMNLSIQTVNCHLNSETSDFLGSLRPTRSNDGSKNSAPFEWVDGPLVEVMKNGGIFLVDEISLADDSVIERMNSVLEPSRSLTLVEGGSMEGQENSSWCKIKAHDTFQFVATMNPGGDFGKKELSPALRNRLVEIWCPSPISVQEDVAMILHQKIIPLTEQCILKGENLGILISTILKFIQWFQESKSRFGERSVFTVRDLVGLISFINGYIALQVDTSLRLECSLIHGACLVVFDGLGSFIENKSALDNIRDDAKTFFQRELSSARHSERCDCFNWITYKGGNHTVENSKMSFKVGNFEVIKNTTVSKSSEECDDSKLQFSLTTKTVACNMLKVLRGMQVSNKPILLEGTPGVGKTSLITALAQITGNPITRINLSDQTEISDLFGSDLPTSNGNSGMASFSWQDGPFLAALKAGHWILLDELNLATQSVLEGLNAALDHRGEIYIPELNRVFHISDASGLNKTRVFGCQNPPRDGGERKNLPKSFLNRFIKVYLNDYTSSDLIEICNHRYPYLTAETNQNLLEKIVRFVIELQDDLSSPGQKEWGAIGVPWQLNLRDILRWCMAVSSIENIALAKNGLERDVVNKKLDIALFTNLRIAKLIFVERFRTKRDRSIVISKLVKYFLPLENNIDLEELFSDETCQNLSISYDHIYLGLVHDQRNNTRCDLSWNRNIKMNFEERSVMESLVFCIKYKWMPILVEENQTGMAGKLVQNLAKLYNQSIRTISLNTASDTSELLGGFEQTGKVEELAKILNAILFQMNHDLEKCFKRACPAETILCILSAKLFVQNQLCKSDRCYSEIVNLKITENIHSSTKASVYQVLKDYIESFKLSNLDCHEIEALLEEWLHYTIKAKNVNNEENTAQFEWVDSVLVNAMENGEWLLIEDSNRCNPSVLDRLNGMLEENGRLEIGEKGCCDNGKVSCLLC